MLKIGITGGIGSGKTTVCQIFKTLGIPVYNSDDRAKYLMNHDEELKNNIQILFGKEAYDVTGKINNKLIADAVFKNKMVLEALNNIVHPAVKKDSETWIGTNTEVPYLIKESALLFETGSYKEMNKNILVIAPEILRIERIKKRSDLTETEIRERMNNQMTDNEKIPLADYIIYNDQKLSLIEQVMKIHYQLLHV